MQVHIAALPVDEKRDEEQKKQLAELALIAKTIVKQQTIADEIFDKRFLNFFIYITP